MIVFKKLTQLQQNIQLNTENNTQQQI